MFDSVATVRHESSSLAMPYAASVPVSAFAVAEALIARRPALGKLALHKLLYFCQGHHLATFGQPLFTEPISAWDNGPVVGALWYSQNRGIDPPESAELGEAELNTIGYVLSRYGALTGQDLMHLTHSEEPWRRANADRAPGTSMRIEQSWIREYFLADRAEREDPELDREQIKKWLRDADARRNVKGRIDDPAEITERIQKLSERTAY